MSTNISIKSLSFNCVLKNKTGNFISALHSREILSEMNQSNEMYGVLNTEIRKLKKGEKKSLSFSAEQAYGTYAPEKVILFPKNKLPKTITVGESISIISKTGQTRLYKVAKLHDNLVSLDQNHPLAGQDLIVEIEAT